MITEKGVFLWNISIEVMYIFTKTVSDILNLIAYYKLQCERRVSLDCKMFRNIVSTGKAQRSGMV